MKVIYAGFSKTGTKSMAAALRELGYVVYDFIEQYEIHAKEWSNIFENGGSTEDFRRMFENVDAVTDLPAGYYWDEIHKAFPDAKIVFSMRENEDEWYKSMKKQYEMFDKWYFRLVGFLSPTNYRLKVFGDNLICAIFGKKRQGNFFSMNRFSEMHMRMTYRRHNANVLQNAPKDKMLIYSPKEGWGSLCKFLGKKTPDTPFPHKNKGGELAEELYRTHPVFLRIKRESLASVGFLTSLMLYSGYKLASGSNPAAFARKCSVSFLSHLLELLKT